MADLLEQQPTRSTMFDDGIDDHTQYSYYYDAKSLRASQARVRRNRKSGLALEEEMFNLGSRYLVMFVTMNYKPEYREDITLATIQRHRDQFIRNMESNPLLQGIQGYIWRLEEGGPLAGLHLHFLIFYSAERKADVWIAKQIGEYWVNVVTRGWGAYWNSNAKKAKFEQRWGVAVGQVNRNDGIMRESLRRLIVNYLAKGDQIPTMRCNPRDRLFGVGMPQLAMAATSRIG